MAEYAPRHRAEIEPREPQGAAAADVFLGSLEYEQLTSVYHQLVGQFDQERSRTGGNRVSLQMAEVALAYPGLYQLIVEMSGVSRESGRHNAETLAFAEGIEAGAVTLMSILKYYADIEKLERSLEG